MFIQVLVRSVNYLEQHTIFCHAFMTLPYLVDIVLCLIYLISWPTLLTNNEYIIDEIKITFTHCYYKNIYHPYFKTFDNIKTIINETIEIGFNFISLKLIFHFSFSFLHKNTH